MNYGKARPLLSTLNLVDIVFNVFLFIKFGSFRARYCTQHLKNEVFENDDVRGKEYSFYEKCNNFKPVKTCVWVVHMKMGMPRSNHHLDTESLALAK